MMGRSMPKRVAALEGQSMVSPIVVILNRDGISKAEAVTRWEAENGPLGDSYLLMVNFVDCDI